MKMIFSIAIGLFAVVESSAAPADVALAPHPPNIVLFYLDDSGYGDFAHNGNPVIQTPNISRLASGGTLFTQFYVTSPACSASRYSLLTGRYPGRSGLGSWVVGPTAKQHLLTEEVTLAEGLKSVGYVTAMFGKWHLGNPNKGNQMTPDSLPLSHGFDSWIGTNVSHDYDNAQLLMSDPTSSDPIAGYKELAKNLPSHPDVSASLTDRYAEGAVEFIRKNKSKRFFAYIAHNQPHLGLYVGDAFKGKSRRGLLGDVMAEIDDSVGRVLQTLKEEGLSEQTLIVFASDNGPWVKFRNTKQHKKYAEARLRVGYAWPFRDGKGSTWEGGHRVPGIFYWPGTIDAQRQLAPASTLDVLPTLFRIAGVELPKNRQLDGRDIGPLLTPKTFPGNVPEFNLLYSYHDNRPSAIRVGPWKLHIRIGSQTGNNYGFSASRETPLLFNVEQDLGERIDRAAQQPELVQSLLKRLDELTPAQ